MSIIATCHCGARFAANEKMAGKKVRCPTCGETFQVPAGSAQQDPQPVETPTTCASAQAPTAAVEQYDELEVVNEEPIGSKSLGRYQLLRPEQYFFKSSGGFPVRTLGGELYDAATKQCLGRVTENASAMIKPLQWVLPKNWLPTRLEIRQGEETAPIFTIERSAFPMPKLMPPRLDVFDADGKLIVTLQYPVKLLDLSGTVFSILAPDGTLVAEAKSLIRLGQSSPQAARVNQPGARRIAILTTDGRELGSAINEEWLKEVRINHPFKGPDNYHAKVENELQGQPLSKVLLLACLLSFELVRQDLRGIRIKIGPLG